MAQNDQLAHSIYEHGEQIVASVTIQRSAAEIAAAWDGLVGMPGFVECLRGVDRPSGRILLLRVASGVAGVETTEIEAEIIRSEPGRIVAWRSTEDTPITNAGSVTLRELPFGRGTELRVVIDFIPPGGEIRRTLERALGRHPKSFLQLALFRLRQMLETGEIATTKGQPAGEGSRLDQASHDEQAFVGTEVKP